MPEITEDSVMVMGSAQRRRRGRPRVDEPMERVSTRLPVKDYDKLAKFASVKGTSVAAIVRRLLRVRIRDFPS